MSDWTLTYNGLTVGGLDTPYKLDQVSGLHDLPEVRHSDTDRPRAHGQYPGADWLGGRSIRAEVTVRVDLSDGDAWQAFSQALVAGRVDELPLLVQFPGLAHGRTLRTMAKVRDLQLPIDADYRAGAGRARIQWWATDPRLYSSTEQTVTIEMASLAGTGRSYPLIYPRTYGGAVTGGLAVIDNDGEFPAPWTARIHGPIDNPRIENVATGQTIGFTGSLAVGESLDLDSLERTVLLNGTVSRYSWLTFSSEWFDFPPGSTPLRFAGTAGAGSIDVTTRSCWI